MSPSTRTGRPRAFRPRQAAAIAAAALLAGGCSAPESAPAAHPSHHPASPTSSAPARPDPRHFSVAGSDPAPANSSQDTHAAAAGTACQHGRLRRNQALGEAAATGFAAVGAQTSANLLGHFLAGTGTPVMFGPRSAIARQARTSSAFGDLNRQVQAAVLARLRAGARQVRLPAADLAPIRFGTPGSSHDLYLGFRGTQGLDVRGTGTITRRGWAGRLTYVIRDSYGFPPRDQLLGIGTAMRYLQVTCGNPPVHGGARWFPDAITVTVPFRHARKQ